MKIDQSHYDYSSFKSRFKVLNTTSLTNDSDIKKTPFSSELEEAILGSILIEDGAIDKIIEVLETNDFYLEAHKLIFKAACSLLENSVNIDIKTVENQLKKNGDFQKVGGPVYLSMLTNKIISSVNITKYAFYLKEMSLRRQLIKYANEINELSYDDTLDIVDIMERTESRLTNICSIKSSDEPTFREIGERFLDFKSNFAKNPDKFKGILSGFPLLDNLTGGWKKSNVIVVAARPSMGKTAFAVTLLCNALKQQKSVAFFSLEMSSKEIFERIMSVTSSIPLQDISNKVFDENDWEKIYKHTDRIIDSKCHIRDSNVGYLFNIKTQSSRIKRKYGLDLIIIDYLQLIKCNEKSFNKEQEISNISRALKEISKELEVPIIVLSQLNRAVESRNDKRPVISDLRDSGAIEQDADIVILLNRPEHYNIMENEKGESNVGRAEINVAKNRNGKTGTINLEFVPTLTRFENWNVY